jgi:high-affinity iron transporter
VLARLNARRAARAVHLGWLGALAAGGATYAIAHGLLQITAGQRELMEGILSLLAAAILFWVSYWLIARSDVQRWMAFLKTRLEGSLGKPRGLWSVAGIAFIAVYREAFETVLFYQALLVDARGQELAVALGAASAGVSLVVAVLLIFRLGKRLPLTAFFLASGALLTLLAAVLGGKGLHALQEAGVLPFAPAPLPRIEWLGIYPDTYSVLVQAAIVTALIAAAAVELARRRRAHRAARAAPHGPGSPGADA